MARRVFLHVGTAKSGTSFLQDLWWEHRGELRERGLLLPGGRRRDHFAAAAVVKGMTAVVETLRGRERDAWRRLVEETRTWAGDALVTNEHFSDSPPDAAAAALADLAGAAEEAAGAVAVWLLLLVRLLQRHGRGALSGAGRTAVAATAGVAVAVPVGLAVRSVGPDLVAAALASAAVAAVFLLVARLVDPSGVRGLVRA